MQSKEGGIEFEVYSCKQWFSWGCLQTPSSRPVEISTNKSVPQLMQLVAAVIRWRMNACAVGDVLQMDLTKNQAFASFCLAGLAACKHMGHSGDGYRTWPGTALGT